VFQRNRKSLAVGAILMFVVVYTTIYLGMRRTYQNLEAVAIKTHIDGDVEEYDWFGENEVLLYSTGTTSTVIQKLNIKSGLEQKIDTAISKMGASRITAIQSLSPDHKWLLCTGYQEGDQAYRLVCPQGLNCLVVGPGDGQGEGAWFPDSSRWVKKGGIGSPISLSEFPLEANDKVPHYELSLNMELPHLMGFARDGSAVIADYWVSEHYEKVAVCQYKYGTQPQIHQNMIVFPIAGDIEGMVLDPQGERMLWQLEINSNRTYPRWLRNLMSYVRHSDTTKPVTLFWICNLNGSDGRIVGSVENTGGQATCDTPSRLRWSPSGKHFSFTVGNSLWVVPVPQ